MAGPDDIRAALEAAETLYAPGKVVAFPQAGGRGASQARPEAGGGGGEPPRSTPPGDDGDGDDDGTGSRDGIVGFLNERYALVLMGSRAIVMRETPDAPIEDRTRVLSIDAFKAYFANRSTAVKSRTKNLDGEWIEAMRYVKWAPFWLQSKERRTYDGVEFFPDPANAPGTAGYFNLWRGFSLSPDRTTPREERWRKYVTFRDHIVVNICSGDEVLARWLFAWFAHILQRPRERIGTAIVLRGKMGTGKTKVGEIIGSLVESHYFLVDDPRYLTGNFNAHMASCLLLQVDEGFWAGDKAAEGRLKGLITAPRQMIEAKGIDPLRIDNYVRLMFSSNEDWVIPAGMDERRFCVLDVAPHVAQNHPYFKEMDRELDAGGREALLADLLDLDLDAADAPNLRVIPKTQALLEQKLRSLDPVTAWWFERLSDGSQTRRSGAWRDRIEVDVVFDDFVHHADKLGVRRKAEKIAFCMRLHKLVPELARRRDGVAETDERGERVWRRVPCFIFPALAACRADFTTAVGQTITWGDDAEGASTTDVGHVPGDGENVEF